ncbi:MAG: SCO6880 family protein [Pseudoclavibacter sp.]
MAEERLVEPAAKFPHRTRIGLVGTLSGRQVLLVGAALLLLLGLSHGAGNPIKTIAVTLPIWGPLLALGLGTYADIPFCDWVTWYFIFHGRKLMGQTIFRRRPGSSSIAKAGTLVLQGGLVRLRMIEEHGSGAIVLDPKLKNMIAVLKVDPQSFMLEDTSVKDQRVDSWATLLGGLHAHQGLVGVQVLLTTSASSPRAVLDYADDHGMAGNAPWVRENLVTLLDGIRTTTLIHESYLVVALSTQTLARMIKDHGGGPGAQFAVMRRELVAVSSGLEDAGLGRPVWLNGRDVARLIREAYDPASSADIANRDGTFEGVDPRSAGPMGFVEHPKFIETDGMFASTWEITEWPRNVVPASFMAPLVNMDFPHTLSMTYQPRSNRRAQKEINSQLSTIQAEEIRKTRRDEKATTVYQRDLEKGDIAQRMADLASGYGELEFTGTVTVYGDGPDRLDAAESALREAAGKCSMDIRRMTLQQEQGFNITTLPLGLKLRIKSNEIG